MQDVVQADFSRAWPAHIHNLTRFLIDCRKAFDGDLDMLLILSLIDDRTFSPRHTDQALDYDGLRDGLTDETPQPDISLRSIADFSGIPRESVRRKISQLVKLGCVAQQRDGALRATRRAKKTLEPQTLSNIQSVSAMIQLFAETSSNGLLEGKSARLRKSTAGRNWVPR